MKKYFYLFVAFVAMITFAACSNDEPNTPDLSDVIEKEIVGNYGGNLKIKLFGQEIANVPQEISIKKGVVENSISLSIANFSFMNLNLGDINLENCPLSGKDGNYTFTNDEPLNLTPFEGFSAVVNLKSGTIVNEEITLVLDIDALLGEEKQKVEVTYTGKRGQAVEEEKSNEAKILSFTFDSDYEKHPNHELIFNPNATISDNNILFFVDKNILAEHQGVVNGLFPTIVVSEGATYTPAIPEEGFDFSNQEVPVKITVTAEDGTTKVDYTVSYKVLSSELRNNFEDWGKLKGSIPNTSGFEWETPNPTEIWASANEGIATILSMFDQYKGSYTMLSIADKNGTEKSAVKLITEDTRGMFMVPAITPGFLYTGKFVFDIMAGMGGKQLSMTQIGTPINGKPKSLKVTYKYTKGSTYIDGTGKDPVEVEGAEDKGLILAVLFDSSTIVDKDGNPVTNMTWLDGYNLKTEANHVMSAYVDGKTGVVDTNGKFVTVEVPFDDLKGYNPDNKNYKIAIACQSSIDGDVAKGAIGSELIIDDIEVITE